MSEPKQLFDAMNDMARSMGKCLVCWQPNNDTTHHFMVFDDYSEAKVFFIERLQGASVMNYKFYAY